jgi:hypothetical protein
VIALVLAAVAVGMGLAVLSVQRLEVGETWDDWLDVQSPIWFTVVQVVLVAMFIGGLLTPGTALTAVLLGVPGGFCVVYFLDRDPPPVRREHSARGERTVRARRRTGAAHRARRVARRHVRHRARRPAAALRAPARGVRRRGRRLDRRGEGERAPP